MRGPCTRFFKPLGRLVARARELRRASKTMSFETSFEDDSGAEEPGEWHDLERALNRIHRDLKRQTTALARESEELSALIGAVSDSILSGRSGGRGFILQFSICVGVLNQNAPPI